MSQIEHPHLDRTLINTPVSVAEDETLQTILRTVLSVQNETGFGSIEITIHEGRVTQIEKREKIRIAQDKPEKQHSVKQSPDKRNGVKQDLHKQGVETLTINKQNRAVVNALHN